MRSQAEANALAQAVKLLLDETPERVVISEQAGALTAYYKNQVLHLSLMTTAVTDR